MLKKAIADVQKIKNLDFKAVLIIIIFAFLVQIVCVLFQISLNVGIIYCPLIYLYKKNINTKFIVNKKHNILFIHLCVFILTLLFASLTNIIFERIITIAYLSFYLLLINNQVNQQTEKSNFSNSRNVVSLYSYFTALLIVILFIDLFEKTVKRIFGFNFNFILIGLLFISIVFSIIFLFTLVEEARNNENESLAKKNEETETDVFFESPLAKEISEFFQSQDLYLNPNFSLSNLSEILNRSKENISDVMNKEMKDGFYKIMAKYRIEHAKKIILENDNFTIEALVVECGFHSKSTFNKYFKMFVGQLPSDFRKNNRDKEMK